MQTFALSLCESKKDNSRGEWVQCVCTEVDRDELRFVFETVVFSSASADRKRLQNPSDSTNHDRVVEKSFRVPRVYEDSDVQSFFERVGYSAETASVMEGDTFWMNMGDERVADSPPNRRDSFKDSLKTVVSRDLDVDSQVGTLFLLVGMAALWPVTATFFGYKAAEKEGFFTGVLVTLAISMFMALMTAPVYDLLLGPIV